MAPPKMKHKTLLSNIFLFLFLTLACTAVIDDAAFMSKLAKALSPTPSGWSGTSFCDWNGVNCTANRVTSINLASQNLSGTLPPDMNSLSQLTSLSLQGNALYGALPSLANLSMLESVVLDGNNFTSITDGCFQGLTSLQSLSIKDSINLAPWTFPTELAQSANLTKLDIGNANLIGTLPDVFDSFVSLTEVRLSYNNLTGVLPKTFGGTLIQNLWLNNQNDGFGFSGTIEVLASMTHLSQVWLQKNQFTGPIPDLSDCTSLFDLQLRDNQLTGVVPPSLMSLPSLKNVSLDYNMFQGPVPSFGKSVKVTFGAEGKIITVNLAKQNLNGTISPAFANLTDLRSLYLNNNNLGGSIPGSLTNLAQLEVLDVSNNNLSGDVPKFSTKVKLRDSGNALLGRSGGGGGNGTTLSEVSSDAPSGSPSDGSNDSSLEPDWIAGISILGAVLFVAAVMYLLCICQIWRWNSEIANSLENGKEGVQIFKGENVTVSIQVLCQVTNNFSEDNILGRGGFGFVYKGEFSDGSKIAVKRMQFVAVENKGMNEFQAEIVARPVGPFRCRTNI